MANKCLACDKSARGAPLCSRCLRDEDTRKAHGVYVPADFSLRGLSLHERMLVLLWASGADITGYLHSESSTITADHPDLSVLDHPSIRMSTFHDKDLPMWAQPTVTLSDEKGVHHG